MKPIGRKNYGSIPHLSNSKLGEGDYYIDRGQERILTEKKRDQYDTIFVSEKYDGSNVGIAKINGEILALTRSGYEAKTSPYKQHHVFSEWVGLHEKIFSEILLDNERIIGEWLLQAHGLIYEISTEPIVFFDYFTSNNERILQEELDLKATRYGLSLPRRLHKGDSVTTNTLLPLLNKRTNNIKSKELPEGMVFRVERKGKVDFLAKWVRNDFPTGQYFVDIKESDLIWNISLSKFGF